MIVKSRIAQGVAFVLALGAHAGVSMGLAPSAPSVEMDSAQGAATAAIGTSFADMAKGIMTAQPVTEQTTPRETSVDPEITPAVRPVQAAEAHVAQLTTPVTALTKTLNIQQTIVAIRPVVAQTVTGTPPPTPADVPKIKPKPKPDRPEPKVKPKPKTKPKPKATAVEAQSQPKGNAAQNAKAGAQNGQAQAQAKVQGTANGRAQANGNAAVSNYPGKVMRKLARAQKIRGTGKARVSFKVAANGGLASVSLRSSSGSPAFDKAALRAVQRAAPFPPPPPGAKRSFSILVTGI